MLQSTKLEVTRWADMYSSRSETKNPTMVDIVCSSQMQWFTLGKAPQLRSLIRQRYSLNSGWTKNATPTPYPLSRNA